LYAIFPHFWVTGSNGKARRTRIRLNDSEKKKTVDGTKASARTGGRIPPKSSGIKDTGKTVAGRLVSEPQQELNPRGPPMGYVKDNLPVT